jgi:hypothetical protein
MTIDKSSSLLECKAKPSLSEEGGDQARRGRAAPVELAYTRGQASDTRLLVISKPQ